MALTKIDIEFSSIVQNIISTQSINDTDKEYLRRQAQDAMQVYGRGRALAYVWRFEAILSGSIILFSIIFGFMGQPPIMWVTPLTIALIGSIVFGILTYVFRARYRARVSNLRVELSVRERKGKSNLSPLIPYVCIVGPFVNNYRGRVVKVTSQKYGLVVNGYSNLGLTFIESAEGGAFDFVTKRAQGRLTLEPNECAIVIANILKGRIVFAKQTIVIPKEAFTPSQQLLEQGTQVPPTSVLAVKPSEKTMEIDKTPNELLEKLPVDLSVDSIFVPAGKAMFFVLGNEVCDMLKPGDYPLTISSFPRLNALNPEALNHNEPSLRLMAMDLERIYRLDWKIEDDVFGKGDVELKVANPRLFLNCVIEDDLLLKVNFEREILSILRPAIQRTLNAVNTSDYDVIENTLLKNLSGLLDKLGLSIVFAGLSVFSKEETTSHKACVNCKKAIPSDSVFCPYCGKKQEDFVCPKCGAEIPNGAHFCPKCGTRK